VAVYDDQDQNAEPGAKSRALHNSAADISGMEREAAKGNPLTKLSSKKSDPEADAFFKNTEASESGGLYHHEGETKGEPQAKGMRGWLQKQSKRRKKMLLAAGGGAAVAIAGIAIIAVMMGSLIIPNFMASVTGYQLARVTRTTVATQSKALAQKVAIDGADDGTYQKFKNKVNEKYPGLKEKWSKLDKWRPAKMMRNLAATSQLDFQYSPPKGVGSRVKLERVVIGGTGVDIPQNTYNTLGKLQNPQSYILDRLDARKDLKAAIKAAMPNSNFLVRAKVAKAIRAKIGARLFRWNEENKKKLNGADKATQDVENLKESRRIATNGGSSAAEAAEKGLSDESKKALRDAIEAQNKCFGDDTCVKEVLKQGGGLSQPAAAAIEATVGDTLFNKLMKGFLGTISPIYGAAVPICLIYEGSTINSEETMSNNMAEEERTFTSNASAADQQRAGSPNVSGEEIGALARQYGQVGRSIPQQRAYGITSNTDDQFSPQASAGGTYEPNILTTVFGSGIQGLADQMDSVCPVITNPAAGVGLAALELIPGVNAGITAAGEVTAQVVTRVIAKQVTQVVRNLFTKKAAAKFTAITVGTAGAAWLARLIVMQHMGAPADGTAIGEGYTSQVDSGGNLYGNDLDRQQNFAGPLPNKQVALLNPVDQQYRQGQFASQSAFQRYFAITNPGSLMNRLAVTTASYTNLQSLSSFLASIPHFLNPVAAFSKLADLVHPFNRMALAADSTTDNQNYHNIQWGWRTDEEAAFEKDPQYSLFTNEEELEKSGKSDSISEDYGKCFTEDIGTLLADQDLVRDTNGNIVSDEGDCAPDNYSPTSSTAGADGIPQLKFKDDDAAMAFRWRVSQRYNKNLDEALNISEVAK
jgi:hypothetical protein